MSRPKRKPSIIEQMQALIAQAIHEKKYELSKSLTDLLQKLEAPMNEKKKEE